MSTHPLRAAATALADSLNPLVVAAAFKAHAQCPNCRYAENTHRFQALLHTYTVWRMRHGRVKAGALPNRHLEWGGYENIYAQLTKADTNLRSVWPCPLCLVRYNPTHRTRRIHSGRRRNRSW